MQQINIKPSILNHLNYQDKFVSFGSSYMKEEGFIVNLCNNNYIVIKGNYYYEFDENIQLIHVRDWTKKNRKSLRNERSIKRTRFYRNEF